MGLQSLVYKWAMHLPIELIRIVARNLDFYMPINDEYHSQMRCKICSLFFNISVDR